MTPADPGLPHAHGRLESQGSAVVFGILNVTPDSFFDGGRWLDPQAAAERARTMSAEGADVIDVGAESTRPGSDPVPPEVQLERLLPVLEQLQSDGLLLSVDTTSAVVARACLESGAALVNDTSALADDPEMAGVVAASGAAVILMHRTGTPKTMQVAPPEGDVVGRVMADLAGRLASALAAGIEADRIVLDPGIGFGKRQEDNVRLLEGLPELVALGHPILVGTSRKSFLSDNAGHGGPEDRLEASVSTAVAAVRAGAWAVRVHDVPETRSALAAELSR